MAFVRSARAAGLTLAEIRGVVAIRDDGRAPCSHVVALLDAKAAAVARQLAELRELARELDRLRQRAARLNPVACDPRTICEVLHPSAR